MEEETAGLEQLIYQKKNRPKYARVISMEFSRGAFKKDDSDCKRKTEKKDGFNHYLDVVTAREDSNSDDSEYYSAEEFIFSSSSTSISSEEESSSLDQSSDSVFDSLQSSTSSLTFESATQTNNSACNSAPQRQRAPSKKQKRKRKKSGNVIDYSLPFCNEDIFDMELEEVREEVVERDTTIMKPVPSLVELCVAAAKRLSKTKSCINVPKTIKRILQLGNSAHSFRHLQLNNLFNILEFTKNKMGKFVHFPYRNIWSSDIGANNSYLIQGCKSSAYLPYYYDYERIPVSDFPGPLSTISEAKLLSALAHTIDIMLPARLSENKSFRRRHKSNTDCHSAEIDHNVKWVTKVLQSKYPEMISDKVISLALPYVFWGRGDIEKASKAFLSLVAMESRVRMKAAYLYDAGRMSLQFGDREGAIRFYQLASDALFTKTKHAQHSDEIDRQTRMLCAAAHDVGLMNLQKAEKSQASWLSAISVKLPDHIQCGGPLSAMDSFLCFYGAYWHEQTGSVYEEAIKNMQTIAEKEAYINFYLSMVYALCGKGKESSKMYRKFSTLVSSDRPLPGKISFSQNMKKPWQPLVDKVNEQGTPPEPMKVVWRVQLVPPRFSDPHHGNGHTFPHEADKRSRKLNLRITADGFITGDMQMVLPPMRGIYLNMYTGNLHLTKIPSVTETWKTYDGYEITSQDQYNVVPLWVAGNSFFLPTLFELYRGHFGETICMLNTSLEFFMWKIQSNLNFNPYLCHLIWTGADGHKVKMNLFYRLSWFIAEKTKKEIPPLNSKGMTDEVKSEMMKLVSKFIIRGWSVGINGLQSYAKYNLAKKTKKDKESKEKSSKTSKPAVPPVWYVRFHIVDHHVFNKGLSIAIADGESCSVFLVIFDVTSKETFMKPNFLRMDTFSYFVKQSSGFTEKSDCFCVFCHESEGSFKTIDRYGEIIDNGRTLMYLEDREHQMDPLTFHSTSYGVLENKRLISCCNGMVSEIDYVGEIFSMKSVSDIIVLLTTKGEIKFVDLPSQLPIEPVISLNKPLDSTKWDTKKGLKILDAVQFNSFKVVGEANFVDHDGKTFTRGAIAVDNNLLIIKVQRNTIEDEAIVTVTGSLTLAGFPTEICFINETVGFLVTVTQHIQTNHHYRENLYHFYHDQYLKGVLMCLGQGPRSFLPVYLPANKDQQFSDPDHGKEGWRVYMRDGHDGIICVRLN